ncbi:MAG: hypothetical protein HY445_00745 [Candidatus Niyogibacteria bacterium]|nr:hypothetical protein [Candidatus Niyogibacteria bacterium]
MNGGDALEKLRKRLYERKESFRERKGRPELSQIQSRASEEWHKKGEDDFPALMKRTSKKTSPLILFLIISGTLALIAVAAAIWFVFFAGGGTISLQGIILRIDAPNEIAGGDLVKWEVVVENKSDRVLETADLIFEYPKNARPVREDERKTLRVRTSLGRIQSGEEVRKTFEGFLFGERDKEEIAKATLEYRAEGANVILATDTKKETRILRSPLTVALRAPEEINSGDEMEIEIEIISGAKEALENITLQVSYPSEFSFRTASLSPSFGDTKWFFSSIRPEERITIKIRGVLTGLDLQKVNFEVSAGLEEQGRISVLYGVGRTSLTLAKPFLDFSYTINDALLDRARPNDFLSVTMKWKNNLPVALENVQLRVRLQGKGFEEATIDVTNGFYRGSDQTVLWNASSYTPFSFVDPGEEGAVKFRFRVPDSFLIGSPSDANVFVKLDGTFEALKRPSGFEQIDVAITKIHEIKITTDLQMTRKALYFFSILPGSGPLPPQVGHETVYTIVWSLVNSTNDMRDIQVKASLPSYMIWKGRTEPSSERIAYDEITGEIVWSVDLLQHGTGFIRPVREARFQVGFIPSAGDVGLRPILVSEVIAEGKDAYTGDIVRVSAPAQNTELRSDPQTGQDDWKVFP